MSIETVKLVKGDHEVIVNVGSDEEKKLRDDKYRKAPEPKKDGESSEGSEGAEEKAE